MKPDSTHIISISLLLATVILLCTSCSKKTAEVEAGTPKGNPVPAGELMDEFIHFQFAIYYLPLPTDDPLGTLKELIHADRESPAFVDEIPEQPTDPVVSGFALNEVQAEYAPPDVDSLQYFGRGLTHDQAQQLQESSLVFIVDFAHHKTHAFDGLRRATRLVESLARKTDGLLWDEETREVFTPDEWQKNRLQPWTNAIPTVSKQVTMHAYNSGEYVRAITLGMAKFGLPDVVVEDFSWSSNNEIGSLINLFIQALMENHVIDVAGAYDLDLRTLGNQDADEPTDSSLLSNEPGVARFALREGRWEEGDPPNRLIEITFDRYPGIDVHARQNALISTIFAWEDDITTISHTDDLLAASERAKSKLDHLRSDFGKGLDPGEYIMVKAPFKTPDGDNEWMWVEITEWDGNRIRGLLINEPFNIPSLHGGQIVNVQQQDVFDYIRQYPDGRQVGNETGEIIRKMQQETSAP